jgi:hypothetical protein
MDERTKTLFADAERGAERIVGQIRMAAALTLGAVFATTVAARAHRPDAVLAVQIEVHGRNLKSQPNFEVLVPIVIGAHACGRSPRARENETGKQCSQCGRFGDPCGRHAQSFLK